MKVVALLPMKSHSERVKGKNFRKFCGKPLFQWVLETLLNVDRVQQIIINTDGREILRQFDVVDTDRVVIRDRRPEICGDFVSMNSVIADDVEHIDADCYIMTHTTNPLLSTTSINGALDKYIAALNEGGDSLFSVNKWQTRFYDEACKPLNHDPSKLVRTQDLTPWYEENSNLYIFSRDSFERSGARIGCQPIMFETPRLEAVDIDTPEDWELAEILVSAYQKKGFLT